MLAGKLLKSHFAKFDLVAVLSKFLEQSHFDKEKFGLLKQNNFKILDKNIKQEIVGTAGFKEFFDEKFQSFLCELMQSKVLIVSGKEYKFSELEIYTCFDANTYKRQCEAGEIDISFKSEPSLYGGVLVRSLKPLNGQNFIFGPRKCALHILNSKMSNLNFDLKEADLKKDKITFMSRIRSFSDENQQKNDCLRAFTAEFEKALEFDENYKKRLNAYKKG